MLSTRYQLVLSAGPISWSSPALKAQVLHSYSETLKSDEKAVLMFMDAFFITSSKLKYFNKKTFFVCSTLIWARVTMVTKETAVQGSSYEPKLMCF